MTPAEIEDHVRALSSGEGCPPLGETALLLAALDRPSESVDPYQTHLEDLGNSLSRLSANSAQTRAMAAAALLHDQLGYTGDQDNYDDMTNANLMAVIDRRKGLPVALAILYIEAARRAGWPAWGLDIPGHFLIRLDGADPTDTEDQMIVDPFHGGVVVTPETLSKMLEAYGTRDDAPEPYEPMPDRAILLRLLNNIRGRALNAGEKDRGLEIMNRMLLVAPQDARLWLESAALQAKAGRLKGAREAIDRCLSLDLSPTDRTQAEQLLGTVKSGLN